MELKINFKVVNYINGKYDEAIYQRGLLENISTAFFISQHYEPLTFIFFWEP
jgi:hypothetical protein